MSRFLILLIVSLLQKKVWGYPSIYAQSNPSKPFPLTVGTTVMGNAAVSAPSTVGLIVKRQNGVQLISGQDSYSIGETFTVSISGLTVTPLILFQTSGGGVFTGGYPSSGPATSAYSGTSNGIVAAGVTAGVATLVAPSSGNTQLNIYVAYDTSSSIPVSVIPVFTLNAPNTPTAPPSAVPTNPTTQPSAAPTNPTATPSFKPTATPSTVRPSVEPTYLPSNPSATPSAAPTPTPSTAKPTTIPSALPSAKPFSPSASPSIKTGSTAPVNTPASSSSSVCFAGSELVRLESGLKKPISEVVIGDRVLSFSTKSNDFVFSDVVSVPHEQNNKEATFQQITTMKELNIKLTPSHLILSRKCSSDSEMTLTEASKIQKGDCLLTLIGEEEVVSNDAVTGNGIYTIVTKEEYVVVSDIVASPFASNHFIPNVFYNVHRILYSIFPNILKTKFFESVGDVADEIAQLYASAESI